MAEEGIAKHTKKIYKLWDNKERSLWHKIKELFIEIFIIVFSVTISVWLHDKSEHSHQQKEIKEFLLGLREDLLSDINEMNNDKASYVNQGKVFNYITSVKLNQCLSLDSLYRKNELFEFGVKNRNRITDSTTNITTICVQMKRRIYVASSIIQLK